MVELLGVESEPMRVQVPFYEEGINAGFPFPPSDFASDSIDLNRELLRSPETTFCGRIRGDSMENAGIHDGDIVVIDRALAWSSGDIVVVYLNGEFTIKRLVRRSGGGDSNHWYLQPANDSYSDIPLEPSDEVRVWGTVTYVIHSLHHRGR